MSTGQAYSGKFKQKVVADMQNSGLSFREAAEKYNLPIHERIHQWEIITFHRKSYRYVCVLLWLQEYESIDRFKTRLVKCI